MEQHELRALLVEHLIAGSLPAPRLLAVLRELAPAHPSATPGLPQLLAMLEDQEAPVGAARHALESLRREVITALTEAAQEVIDEDCGVQSAE